MFTVLIPLGYGTVSQEEYAEKLHATTMWCIERFGSPFGLSHRFSGEEKFIFTANMLTDEDGDTLVFSFRDEVDAAKFKILFG